MTEYIQLFKKKPNKQTISSSNFKRQNTIDSSSIKENSARLAQNQRPASAQPKAVSSNDSK